MNKYNATKTTVDGIVFDSKKEATRYGQLKLLERAGKISDLKIQPRYLLQESFKTPVIDQNGVKIKDKTIRKIEYVADFEFKMGEVVVVEDVKGFQTAIFKLKLKLFLKKFPELAFIMT